MDETKFQKTFLGLYKLNENEVFSPEFLSPEDGSLPIVRMKDEREQTLVIR